MSLYHGPLTYKRLFVEESAFSQRENPDLHPDTLMEKLAAHPFEPLDPEGQAVERIGWCRSDDAFETSFTHESVFFNDFVNLGLRIDRWVVPPALLRAKCREAEASYLEKKGRDRLTRKERAEIKDMVAKKLRRQLAPTTRIVEVSWEVGKGVLRFFSHSASVSEAFGELFYGTFGRRLIPDSPYIAATQLHNDRTLQNERVSFEPTLQSAAYEAAWAALEPTIFVSPEGAR